MDNEGSQALLSYFPNNGNDLSAKYNHLGRRVENPESYRLAIGAWGYTKSRGVWLGGTMHGKGIYAILEGNLYEERTNKNQGLNGFVRFGFTNQKINRFTAYADAGLVYTGLFEDRANDQIGLAIALAWGAVIMKPFSKIRACNLAHLK